MNFVPFWFESDAVHGPVTSIEDWERIVARSHVHGNANALLDQACTAIWNHPTALLGAGGLTSIGTRREHIGGHTLRFWAPERGMEEALSLEGTSG